MTLSKNTLALIFTGILVFGFFISGIFGMLNYIIVKALLFSGFGALVAVLVWIAIKDQQADTK